MIITILTGSYNLNGTSNTLVNEFIRGASENGHEIHRYDTAHLDIHACTGCNRCGMDGECIFDDDMNEILKSILKSDLIVFATPIYYFAMTAPLKACIDRFYSQTMRISSKGLKSVLITTCWNTDDSTVNPVIWHYEKMVDYMNYENMGRIIARGSGTVNMMPKHFLTDSYELAKKL
ncbi:MAG: FMN reductase [Methanosphaera sp. SHI613]|jgi:multimeric flavodoxin WrbA|nr:MAG: FMN reductase [Methanosphaera sp. SHI613]